VAVVTSGASLSTVDDHGNTFSAIFAICCGSCGASFSTVDDDGYTFSVNNDWSKLCGFAVL
jgi:hypothetical protein